MVKRGEEFCSGVVGVKGQTKELTTGDEQLACDFGCDEWFWEEFEILLESTADAAIKETEGSDVHGRICRCMHVVGQ